MLGILMLKLVESFSKLLLYFHDGYSIIEKHASVVAHANQKDI